MQRLSIVVALTALALAGLVSAAPKTGTLTVHTSEQPTPATTPLATLDILTYKIPKTEATDSPSGHMCGTTITVGPGYESPPPPMVEIDGTLYPGTTMPCHVSYLPHLITETATTLITVTLSVQNTEHPDWITSWHDDKYAEVTPWPDNAPPFFIPATTLPNGHVTPKVRCHPIPYECTAQAARKHGGVVPHWCARVVLEELCRKSGEHVNEDPAQLRAIQSTRRFTPTPFEQGRVDH